MEITPEKLKTNSEKLAEIELRTLKELSAKQQEVINELNKENKFLKEEINKKERNKNGKTL